MNREGKCCFVQLYCDHFDIRQTSSRELSQRLGFGKQETAWILRQIGWDSIKTKTEPFYVWARNGHAKDFNASARAYARKKLKRLLEATNE